jgi:transposase
MGVILDPAKTDEWGAMVAQLGGEEALSASARQHRAFLRARGVRSPSDLLRLAFLYGPGGHSLRVSAALAAEQGLADVSDVALLNRLAGAGSWMQGLCAEAFGRLCPSDTPLPRRSRIHIVDGSRIEGPGDTAWRLHLCYDPVQGRMVDAGLTALAQGERLDRLAVAEGAIRLADRAFPQPDGIKNTLDSGADVLVRLTWNSVKLTDQTGQALDWLALFDRAKADGGLDQVVDLRKARGHFPPLRLRLVIQPKPPEAAAQALKAARRAHCKGQHRRLDPRTLAVAEHLVLLTSLSDPDISGAQVAALYRLRWQVELTFKRLKSILRLDRLRATDEGLVKTWVHVHLLLALLIDHVHSGIEEFPP